MSLRRYREYKDSGVEWLGEVPAHWQVSALRRSQASPVTNGIFKKKEDFGSGTLLINVFDIYREDFRIDYSGLDRINCTTEEQLAYQVRQGDIFFVRSSLKEEGIAAVSVAEEPAEAVVFECHLIRARTNQTLLDGRFCSYLFNSGQYRHEMIRRAKVTTMTTIDQEAILSFPVVRPPIDEQGAIVTFLDRETAKVDALVAEQQRLIELLKEKREAVVSHAITAPVGENTTKLGHLITLKPGYAFPSEQFSHEEGGVRLLRGINVSVGECRWEETVHWTAAVDEKLSEFLLETGDIVLGMDRPWIGAGTRVAKITNEDLPCLLVQRVARIRARPKQNQPFIRLALASREFKAHLEADLTGVSIPHVSPEQICSFPTRALPQAQQILIAQQAEETLSKLDALLCEAERSIALLQERRTALISAAVTGKIDVRDLAASQPTRGAAA